MIEIYNAGKWIALKVIDKEPDLSALRVMHDPADRAFHTLLALNGELLSFKFHGGHYVGVFNIDSTPVFEAHTVEFCRASISKEVE